MVGGRSQVPALLDPASSTAGTSITYTVSEGFPQLQIPFPRILCSCHRAS
jgi:hypothetical protein